MRRPLTALLFLGSLLACGDGEGGGAYIRATFDGHVWSAEAQEGEVVYYVDIPEGDGIFTIASRQVGGGSQFISLVLPMPPDLGPHALNGSTTQASFASCPNDILADCIYWAAVSEHPGTLTIDHVDPNTGLIEGDFAFNGYALGDPEGSVKAFTAGHFRIYAPSVFILE